MPKVLRLVNCGIRVSIYFCLIANCALIPSHAMLVLWWESMIHTNVVLHSVLTHSPHLHCLFMPQLVKSWFP